MKYIRYILICFILTIININTMAQTDRYYITQGNRLYAKGKFSQAEVMYRKAIEKRSNNPQAIYNLGNALLMQKKDSAAINQWQAASKVETNKTRLAKSYHNIGVVCQAHQMYSEAIKAYEEALRNNPNDNRTRYNLVLCKKLLKKHPDNKNKNKNKNKNQKNKDKNNKDKQNQDKNKNQKDKNNKQNKQQNKNQMSKENAEQLLNAAIQQEQATQQRMKKAMQQPKTRQLQKNW